jgi:pilus assembly protein CpaB
VLVGLALVLGGLAAADVSRREAALDARLAPLVPVLVARTDLEPGRPIAVTDVEPRELPARWAPVGAAGGVAGATPAVRIPRGAYVTTHDLAVQSTAVRRGERAVEVVAAGPPELIAPGGQVDVLVTREGAGTRLALQGVEVLATRTVEDRLAATLRVTLRQAVHLADAQSFAREIRLRPRPASP